MFGKSTASNGHPFLAIACFSASIFLLEVLLTRLFSVILFYHFAFVAISVGMLGLAAAGVRVALAPERFTAETAARDIHAAALRYTGAAVVAVLIFVQVGLSPNYTWLRAVAIVLIYAIAFIPFYFGGLALTLLLTHYRRDFAKLYAVDLAAAGTSGLLVVPLLTSLGAPSALLVAALVALAGATIAFPQPRGSRERQFALAIAGITVLALVADASFGALRIRRPKEEEQGGVIFEAWNALSRVAVYDLPMKPWSVGPRYAGPVPAGLHMDIDASAATPILRGMAGSDVEYLKAELTAVAYVASPHEHSVVIGSGGGRDVLSALLHGMKNVEAVEINSIIVNEVMKKRFRDFSGGIYDDPRVHVHVGDGRSFIRRSHDLYDVIQASLVDTWAATAAGAFALSENNLYTEEAMTEYIAHLSDDGILTLVRWSGPDVYRLVIMLHAAAGSLGIDEPARHMAILEAPHTADPGLTVSNVLFRHSPFDAASLAALEQRAQEAGFTWAHHPMHPLAGRTSEIARAGMPLAEAHRTENYELRPSRDDWPFFFYRPRPTFFGAALESPRRLYTEGAYLVAEILFVATVLGFCSLLLPMWRRGREALLADPRTSVVGGLYFVCIGVGFMFLEVGMMQRFVLFLGHPTYALTAVMVGLMVGAGVGSSVAGKLLAYASDLPLGTFAGVAATGAVMVSNVVHPVAFSATQHWSFFAKVLFTQAMVAPLGLLLGMLMPLGIAQLTANAPRLVPWAWSVNGFASVVGSCVAVFLSMDFGFSTTFRSAAGCYALAALASLIVFRWRASLSYQPASV